MSTGQASLQPESTSRRPDAGDRRYLTVAQAAKMFPVGRNGKPTHTATLTRWILQGTRGPNGAIERLYAVRCGGRWLTTQAWLDDYVARLTPRFDDEPSPVRSSGERSRSAEQASRALDAIGI